MTIILTNVTLPERGQVAINLSFEIKVTAEEAKRKVTWWLREEVSMLIYGETPTLVVGERPVWRVPAWIAFPSTGPLGEVGTAEVNADTGEMLNPEGFKSRSGAAVRDGDQTEDAEGQKKDGIAAGLHSQT